MTARRGVECDEVAVANRTEDDVARRREDAVGQRALKDLEIPHRLAGFRIQRLDPRGRRRFTRFRFRGGAWLGTADVLTSLFERNRSAGVLLAALGVLEIHPAGPRTVRRRLVIRAADERGIHEEAAF